MNDGKRILKAQSRAGRQQSASPGRAKGFRPTEEYDGQVRCPWCESIETKLVSPYGPSVAEMMFECQGCGQGFGWLKWQHRLPD